MCRQVPQLKMKLWIDMGGKNAFGMGSAALLRGVDQTGSLAGAAKALGMSYRAAWGRIRKIEERLGTNVLIKRGGNKSGYDLSFEGQAFLEAYEALQKSVEEVAQRRFNDLFADLIKRGQKESVSQSAAE
ncbi:winged helix-turn-helix domain-containing protein [Oleidesulfovibrio sp.]|uniref:winged helix-turn-helix domain-containing protein n=1 Tax=Oleidesulfovibrio sp. TaxID=2909707 RepID=UPI003A837FD3